MHDLIVVGGGPAGAVVASFVAMQGHKVLLLERERFPRYQIGESLLPSTVHGICVMLGVDKAMRAARFIRKHGGTFKWGRAEKPWTFSFGDLNVLGQDCGYAYQVPRSRFDAILLRNARRVGVDVRERHAVKELLTEGERVVGIRFTDHRGRCHVARARYTVDASGHQSRFFERIGKRLYSRFFRNIAVFGYFHGGKRLPPPNSGNILSVSFGDGWFWYIPLTRELTSVGCVVGTDRADEIQKKGLEAFLFDQIDRCPLIRENLSSATRVTRGPYGRLRVRRDYSYCNSRFWGPGLALVGDAACFVDPIFSSGVHLATYSALLAARSINTLLRGDLDETACFEEFEKRYRMEYGNFYEFLVQFYDAHKDWSSYFWEARKVLKTDEKDNIAFIRLVAGMGSREIPLLKKMEGSGERMNAYIASVTKAEAKLKPPELQRLSDKLLAPGVVKARQTRLELHWLARLGALRPPEKPLFPEGLIPSPDGLHWQRPPLK